MELSKEECEKQSELGAIFQLIKERLANQPLGFEELTTNIYDNKLKKWYLLDSTVKKGIGGSRYEFFIKVTDGCGIHHRIKFEEGRFYAKEVR